jgi:hypothetical protein
VRNNWGIILRLKNGGSYPPAVRNCIIGADPRIHLCINILGIFRSHTKNYRATSVQNPDIFLRYRKLKKKNFTGELIPKTIHLLSLPFTKIHLRYFTNLSFADLPETKRFLDSTGMGCCRASQSGMFSGWIF